MSLTRRRRRRARAGGVGHGRYRGVGRSRRGVERSPEAAGDCQRMKRIIIIAGPNGAGKTAFAREYLLREAACPNFINADLIAAGLSPFDPAGVAVQAGR